MVTHTFSAIITRKSAVRRTATIPAGGLGTLYTVVLEVGLCTGVDLRPKNDLGISTSVTLTFDFSTGKM